MSTWHCFIFKCLFCSCRIFSILKKDTCSPRVSLSSRLLSPCLPETVEDVAVGVNPQHDVICCGVVDERALGVDEEHVGDPDLLHQATVEGHALVVGAGERQPLVLPVVTQVQSHGEVLQGEKKLVLKCLSKSNKTTV